jgi:alpha-L-fucosidase
MKYIVITSKHHDGFAMYHSKACDFNIVDATPWKKDPMKELAAACREAGIRVRLLLLPQSGLDLPRRRQRPENRCRGQPCVVRRLLREEVPAPGQGDHQRVRPDRDRLVRYARQDAQGVCGATGEVVRKNQPHALVSGRAGHGLGDYQTLGDMEVPRRKHRRDVGSVDTTNDSWAYAWYDEYWKSPKEILHRLIACVGRGGTYMLNIGPRGDGTVPERAARSLREAGEWIRRYPQVVYGPTPRPGSMPCRGAM